MHLKSRIIAILLTLFPVLFASGDAVSALKVGHIFSHQSAQVDRVLGSSVRSRVYTVNFYDKHERVVFSQQAVADNSIIKTSTSYDFAGNPSSVSTTSYIGNNTFTDTYTYGYDRLNRPTTVTLRHNGGDVITINEKRYDNLGRLSRSIAPGNADMAYYYDKRSQLYKLSSNPFIQTLSRSDKTKYPSKSGRITYNDIRLSGIHFTFNYLYDSVGRLKRAECLREQDYLDYSEEFDYDLNTNIIGLRRYGGKNHNTSALLDDLTMTYEGNQLRYITDDATDYPYEASLDFRAKAPIEATPGASVAAPFGLIGGFNPIDSTIIKPNPGVINPINPTYSADYAYDANGNMTQDRHSSITSIAYNVLNLPQTVTYEGLTINRPVSQIVYDASGKKHIVRNGALRLNKFYGDETRYIGDYIMVNDTIDRLQTPYGYLRDGEFHSYLFDYQGNIVCVMAGNKVVQTNFYYADGLPMNNCTGVTANAFKYTAKELSLFRGLPVYDYTARHTLPQINRFRTMDPLAEKYQGISPYAFCAGDPINFSDPTGQDIEAIINDIKYKYCRLDGGGYAFIDADGNQYEGGNDFGDNLVEALNNIQEGAVGKALVYSLVESSNTLTLEAAPDSGKNMTYNSAKKGECADVRIEWNPSDNKGGYSQAKDGGLTRERPAFIGLSHELGHAFDVMVLNNWEADDWYKKGIKRSEIIAGDIENAIRYEHNISPRLYYGYNEKQGKYNTSVLNYYLTLTTCILGAISQTK